MWQFGWVYRHQAITNFLSQNRSRFGHFLGTARLSASDYIIEGDAHSAASRKFVIGAFVPRKTTNTKGELHEKTSLNCIGGKWIGFRPRATF